MLSFTQGCIIKMWGIAYFAGHYWLNLRIVNITVFEAPNFLLILKLGEVGCDYMGPQKGKRKPYTCKRLLHQQESLYNYKLSVGSTDLNQLNICGACGC